MPPSTQSEALGNNALEVVFSAEPWLTRNLQGGNAVLWMAPKDLIPDFEYGVLLFGPSLLKDDPEAGKRFMTAYLEGIKQYDEGKTSRNLEIIAKFTGIEPDILEAACWPSFRQDGSITIQSVMNFQEWAVKMGYLDVSATAEQLWEPMFIEAASQALVEMNP
jgi:NitT/TauT family transport system substrate-binding protein